MFSDNNWRHFDDFPKRLRFDGDWGAPQSDGRIAANAFSGLRDVVAAGFAAGKARSAYRDLALWGVDNRQHGWEAHTPRRDRVDGSGGHLLGLQYLDGDPAEERSVMQAGSSWLAQQVLGRRRLEEGDCWVDAASMRTMHAPLRPPQVTKTDLFSTFTAVPTDTTPPPGAAVSLTFSWPPSAAEVESGSVRIQTEIGGTWTEVVRLSRGLRPATVPIGTFDRPAL